MIEITASPRQGGLDILGQQTGFRGDPDLLQIVVFGTKRLDPIHGAARQVTQKPETPVGEDSCRPITEDLRPTIDVRVTKETITASVPFRFNFRHQAIGTKQGGTFNGPRPIVDHGQHQPSMQTQQVPGGSPRKSRERDTTVSNLGQPMTTRLARAAPWAIKLRARCGLGDLISVAIDQATSEEVFFQSEIEV